MAYFDDPNLQFGTNDWGGIAAPARKPGGADVSPLSKYLDMLGVAAGGFANQTAQNRLIDRNTEPAADAANLRNLLHSSYVADGGATGQPGNLQFGLPSFGLAPRAPSSQAVSGASTLRDEILKRLKEGPDAGWGEKLGGALSAMAPFAALAF